MGYPSKGMEALVRNPLEQVQLFLKKRHKQHHKVYNLCIEKERIYPEGTFDKMKHYGFFDHNPPSIKMMEDFCLDLVKLGSWRTASSKKTTEMSE